MYERDTPLLAMASPHQLIRDTALHQARASGSPYQPPPQPLHPQQLPQPNEPHRLQQPPPYQQPPLAGGPAALVSPGGPAPLSPMYSVLPLMHDTLASPHHPALLAQEPPAQDPPVPAHDPPPPPPAQDPPPPPPAQDQPPAQPPPGPVPRPQAPPWGRWLDRDTNPCLNFQRIGQSMQRPLELCCWTDLKALPPVGKEYQQRYKLVNDRLPKVRQRLHRAAEYRRGIDGQARNNA
ncbi:hypothetical protein QJQ45_006466 [Haematococcus lacustris]|nr:hypothetical protein QJQ45_006466 [Haematococcus lacustris]